MLPHFIHGQQHCCSQQAGHSSCEPGHRCFQWQGIYSQRTIKRERNPQRTCLLTVCSVVFISFINNSWNTRWRWEWRALSVQMSSTVMRRALFSFGFLSPLWHPKLLGKKKKKALRASAGLSWRTVSSVCGKMWNRSTSSLLHGWECSSERCAQGTSWIFGSGAEKSHVCTSAYLHPGEFLGYSYKSKTKWSWVPESHPTPQERALPLPPPPTHTHPWGSITAAVRAPRLVKNSTTSGTAGHICTSWQSRVRAWALALAPDCPYHRILSMLNGRILAHAS